MPTTPTAYPDVATRKMARSPHEAAGARTQGDWPASRRQCGAAATADGEGREGLRLRGSRWRASGWSICWRAARSATSTTSCGSTRSTRLPRSTMAADPRSRRGSRLLNAKGVTFAAVSRAPYASIARYKDEHGWTLPWYSSRDSDFRLRLPPSRWIPSGRRSSTTTSPSMSCTPPGLTTRILHGDWPGASVFLRRGDEVSHAYSAFARGLDHSAPGYPFLDLTPYGRQEKWEDCLQGGRRVLTRSVCRWTSSSDHRDPNAGPVPARWQRHEPLRVWLSRYSSRNPPPPCVPASANSPHIGFAPRANALSKKHVGAQRSRLS